MRENLAARKYLRLQYVHAQISNLCVLDIYLNTPQQNPGSVPRREKGGKLDKWGLIGGDVFEWPYRQSHLPLKLTDQYEGGKQTHSDQNWW